MSHYIVSGLIKKITGKKNLIGLKNLTSIISEILAELNVSAADPCCDNQDVTNRPVKFNEATQKLQYFDSVTKTYVDVP